MSTYTYTIFDANPQTSSGTAWHDHEDVEMEASSDEEAIAEVLNIMQIEAAGLNPDDGYEAGQQLYALVWDKEGIIVGDPTYTLSADDLA